MAADGSTGLNKTGISGNDGSVNGKKAKAARHVAPAAAPTSNRVRLGVAAAALAFYAVFILRTSLVIGGTRYFVLFEDAMISMRYARHLADGHGFGADIRRASDRRLHEPALVVWMAFAHKLGLSEPKISLFVMLSGVAILLTTGEVPPRGSQGRCRHRRGCRSPFLPPRSSITRSSSGRCAGWKWAR